MQKNYVSPDYMKDSFTCPHCGTLSLMNYVKVNYFRGKYRNHSIFRLDTHVP